MRKLWPLGAALAPALALGAVLAPGAAARLHRDPADASGPLDLTRIGVEQVRRDVRLSVHVRGEFDLSALAARAHTSSRRQRFLCLHLKPGGAPRGRQLCFGKRSHGGPRILMEAKLGASGKPSAWRRIHARVERPGEGAVVARFRPNAAGLSPRTYRWRALSEWAGPKCPGGRRSRRDPCADQAPNGRQGRFRLREVQPVACTAPGPSPVFHGPRGGKRIALTFDDGPSGYTERILSILHREHARGTFFEIGAQVRSGAAASRAVVESGNELGNHSYRHETKPGRASMVATNHRIEAASGFRPCLFRPPGGAFDSRVVADARSLGMTTVVWDVDPRDWSTPGTSAIYGNVVSHARPGSIVIMHDGGGNRSQTVAALPRIIHTLRGRGYRFVTVTKLLGGRIIWGPAS